MNRFLPLAVAAALATDVLAHDPYEITSIAYIHSNRIELFIEMEFPAGMKLAGTKPVQGVAVVSQFESALPRLRELAGSFYRFTAGNNVLYPISTNVELGVEDHIRFKVEYPPTTFRPLRFVADGLGANSVENPYGTSLTVLDMVNQKVLGQTTLFSAIPAADFPPKPETTVVAAPITIATANLNNAATVPIQQTHPVPPPPIQDERKSQPNLLLMFTMIAGAIVLAIVVFRRRISDR